MYPRISWELVADPFGSAERTKAAAALDMISLLAVLWVMT